MIGASLRGFINAKLIGLIANPGRAEMVGNRVVVDADSGRFVKVINDLAEQAIRVKIDREEIVFCQKRLHDTIHHILGGLKR